MKAFFNNMINLLKTNWINSDEKWVFAGIFMNPACEKTSL